MVTTFAYDGFGRRVKKTSTSGTFEYLWDGDQIMAEVKSTGSSAVVRTYTYYPGVDQPRSVTVQGETYFTSAEPDGTVNGLIRNSDRTVVAQYKYTPWGEIESAAQALDTMSSLRWKGLPYDAETGLYYMRARYYDPVVRRFVSEDPAGLSDGLNLYTFAGNDPVNSSDPSGLRPVRDRGICSIYSFPCRGSDALEDWMISMHANYDDDIDVFCYVGGDPGRYISCMHDAARILGSPDDAYRACAGSARVLKGNAATIGKPGGWSGKGVGDVIITATGAAIIPEQWGGKAALRPYLNAISATFPAYGISFQGVVDVMGGKSPIPGMGVRDAMINLNPNFLLIELPGASRDYGQTGVNLTVPSALACPQGTVQVPR